MPRYQPLTFRPTRETFRNEHGWTRADCLIVAATFVYAFAFALFQFTFA